MRYCTQAMPPYEAPSSSPLMLSLTSLKTYWTPLTCNMPALKQVGQTKHKSNNWINYLKQGKPRPMSWFTITGASLTHFQLIYFNRYFRHQTQTINKYQITRTDTPPPLQCLAHSNQQDCQHCRGETGDQHIQWQWTHIYIYKLIPLNYLKMSFVQLCNTIEQSLPIQLVVNWSGWLSCEVCVYGPWLCVYACIGHGCPVTNVFD